MGIFRSEQMTKKHIRISKDHCEEVMDTLGNVENGIEFIDLNKDNLEAKKGYAGMIKRCDEMEKRINKFENLVKQHKLNMYFYENYDDFRNELRRDQTLRRALRTDYFDIIENEIINEEKELDQFLENKGQNLDNLNSLLEHREILRKLNKLTQFQQIEQNHNSNYNNNNFSNPLNQEFSDPYVINDGDRFGSEENIRGGLQFISGVILAENELKLRRTIFRVSYGLGLTTFWDMDPNSFSKISNTLLSDAAPKKIFTIFLKNSDPDNNYLFGKLVKICDALGASRYQIPHTRDLVRVLNDIERDIFKMETVLDEQRNSIRALIEIKIGTQIQPGKYCLYRLYFKKQKEIYLNLSKCKASNSFYDGEIWVLDKKMDEILNSIISLANSSSNHHGMNIMEMDKKEENLQPPTYIDSNDFIWPFQEIVNTYGIPRYQEINPTVFNIVTFPFLFGVMFGDIGHGFILLIFAIYLCIFSDDIKNNKKSLLRPLIQGRYLLLLMGIFAFYCGWIYNEFFSVAIPAFGESCYTKTITISERVKEYQKNDPTCVYKFGLDPKWQIAQNELSFHNSIKMKLSVILGVFHMLFGIVLKGINCIHFKNKLGFIFEFIPQFIFMSVLFGYMDVMIFIKWMRDWKNIENQAPSLISQLMNIFLKLGSVQDKPLWENSGQKTYSQESWHLAVLIISLICVPLMLLPKPILEYYNFGLCCKSSNYINLSDEHPLKEEIDEDLNRQDHSVHEQHHSFGDIFVHQTIETIEFVLGAISNTASYLRLWALSLAHGQLSRVFFEKALLGIFDSENVIFGIILLVISFFVFINVTFAVLMSMDLLECFLHTLRLHWVEFQNKFYKADGYKFSPFSFRQLLNQYFDN